jgi:hypothetical protein
MDTPLYGMEHFDREFERLQQRGEGIIQGYADNFEAEIAHARMFELMCSEIKGDYSRFDKVLEEFQKTKAKTCLVEPFNLYIGFSVPEKRIIDLLYTTFTTHLEKYPGAKLVDLGTGSGIYPWLLSRKGIAKEKLLAVDLVLGELTQKFECSYWDILRHSDYVPHINDMVFISWGYGRYPSLDTYLLNGGKCVVILGEIDGITLDVQLFSNKVLDTPEYAIDFPECDEDYIDLTGKEMSDEMKEVTKGWDVEMYSVLTLNMWSQDYLSINTKYIADRL